MSERVADMTMSELHDLLRGILRDLVDEALEERLGLLKDPDEGLTLNNDFVKSLEIYLASDRRGEDADTVFRELGLD